VNLNRFSPGSIVRGQPSLYGPSSTPFTVPHSGSLTWFLNGRSVTANASTPAC
jgi:hypothetical protein